LETLLLPTLEEALYIHKRLIGHYGGAEGMRDRGLLESALARPRSGYYKSLSEQAAALMHSIIGNHCFVDGNKRVGFALTAVFLRINGYKMHVAADEAERFIIDRIIRESADVYEISSWLEQFIEPL
jgi:death on curing protein